MLSALESSLRRGMGGVVAALAMAMPPPPTPTATLCLQAQPA